MLLQQPKRQQVVIIIQTHTDMHLELELILKVPIATIQVRLLYLLQNATTYINMV